MHCNKWVAIINFEFLEFAPWFWFSFPKKLFRDFSRGVFKKFHLKFWSTIAPLWRPPLYLRGTDKRVRYDNHHAPLTFRNWAQRNYTQWQPTSTLCRSWKMSQRGKRTIKLSFLNFSYRDTNDVHHRYKYWTELLSTLRNKYCGMRTFCRLSSTRAKAVWVSFMKLLFGAALKLMKIGTDFEEQYSTKNFKKPSKTHFIIMGISYKKWILTKRSPFYFPPGSI